MNFASDNWAGATPEVADALARANAGFAPAYGGDALTKAVERTFCDIFEREVEVLFVTSGTAANTLCLSAAARPGGLVFCTGHAHVHNDEFGATEAFTGMKLVPLPSPDGLMAPAALEEAMAAFPQGRTGPFAALSLTNASELGTVYSPQHIAELSRIAHARGMAVHLDGARFANAVAALGAKPADLAWRAGVDLMSFGGTKNGCWAAEAVVVFEPGHYPDLPNLRQRAGQGLSKQRFIAAQYEGYFADGTWLRTAAHANAMCARLRSGLKGSGQARFAWESSTNELFPILGKARAAALRAAGANFHTWRDLGGEEMIRLVTSFATTAGEVDGFLGLL